MGPTKEQEVAYLNGINPDGSLQPTSYWGDGGGRAHKWGSATAGTGATITYRFDAGSGFSAQEKDTFRGAFALWAAVANVTFTEVSSGGDALLRRGTDGKAYTDLSYTQGGFGLGTPTGQALISVDTSVYSFDLSGSYAVAGGYGMSAVIHEVGHLLGLGHGGDYNGIVDPATQQHSAFDERMWTTMSYIGWTSAGSAKYAAEYPFTGTDWGTATAPHTPMLLDIVAVQQLYGAPASTPLAGGQVFGFNSNVTGPLQHYFDFTVNTHPVVTLSDKGFNNKLDLTGFGQDALVNLAPATFSSAGGLINNITIAFDTRIESAATGSGNDRIYGTELNNGLYGGGGDDLLVGGAGADALDGGSGFDTAAYDGAAAGVLVDLQNLAASTGDAAGDTFLGIEAIAGTYGFADQLLGDDGANTLIGRSGNDSLLGRGGADTLRGDEGDDFLVGGAGADVLDGGSGFDVAAYDGAAAGVVVDLQNLAAHAGDAAGDTFLGIEAIAGSYDFGDTLRGDGGANVFYGRGGNDVLFGRAGNDTLMGDEGDDTLAGGQGADALVGGDGFDTALYDQGGETVDLLNPAASTGEAAGDTFAGIEAITATGGLAWLLGNHEANTLRGGGLHDQLEGRGGNDSLFGEGGDDLLIGGPGADALSGGEGTDTATYDGAGIILDLQNGGANTGDAVGDTLSGIEIIVGSSDFADELFGDAGANVFFGRGGSDKLSGRGGNDMLYGGAGADTLVGGLGDDGFDVDAAGDVVIEAAGEGVDTVWSTVSFILDGTNVENLTLSGTANVDAVGSGAANVLVGNSGNNVLNGLQGADTMIGGLGDDTYVVYDAGDVVTELAGQGNDLVYSQVSFILSGTNAERLTLIGSANVDAIGSSAANVLVGNAGNNVLNGLEGPDTMSGGAGDDTYVVYDAGDVVQEIAGQGNDLVYSTVSFMLDGTNAERLALIGSANVNAVGSQNASDVLTGNGGDNILNGVAGNDTMTGGAGRDTFYFGQTPGAANTDTITDFVSGLDAILLERSVFSALASGPVSAAAFKNIATGTVDADDRILYNGATGALLYDPDGSGTAASTQFATLSSLPSILAGDIIVG